MSEHKTLKNFSDLIKNTWRLQKLIWAYSPWNLSGILFFTVVAGATPILAYKAMGKLIDALIAGVKTGSLSAVWIALAIYAGLNLLSPLATVFNRYFDRINFLRLQNLFEIMVIKKRAGFDISQYEDPEFLDFLQRAFRNGFFSLMNLNDGLIGVFQILVTILAGSAAALAIDWRVFLIVITSSIPLLIVEIKYGGEVWGIWAKNSPELRRKQDLERFFSTSDKFDVIDGKLYQVGSNFIPRIKQILENFTDSQLAAEKGRTWSSLAVTFLAGAGLLAGSALMIKDALIGSIAIGTVVFAFQALLTVSEQTSQLLRASGSLLLHNLSVTDVFKVLDTEPVLIQPQNPQPLNLSPDEAPHIKFENVSFKYSKADTYALKNVSFEIKPGEKLGLVGNNGSGKTTIVRLLLRIYDPTAGRITVNGIDLRELDQAQWWKLMGVLLQDYATYNFSVKEAIAVGQIDSEIKMPVVEKSAEQSTASTFINEIKDHYDHMIGVEFGGIEPSKGQRQKLAIARALYRQPKILILDEPTASIDAESASVIFQEIENLPKSTSAVLISHNFATLKKADQIIVLDRGEIIEQGTHLGLVKKGGKYAVAYEKQKKEHS